MRVVRRLIIVSSLVSTLFSINSIAGLELLPCLPLLYLLVTCICIPKYVVMGTGMMMLLLVLSIRYIVYPLLLCQDCFISDADLAYAPHAILLMLIEMCVIGGVIKLYFLKRKNICVNELEKKPVKGFVPLLLLLVFILILFLEPNVFANKHFVFSTSDISLEKVKVSGVFTVPVSWFEWFGVIYLFSLCYVKFYKTKWKSYYLLSVFIICLSCFTYEGNSRLSLLVPLVAMIGLLQKAYGNYSNRTVKILVMGGFVLLGILSMNKFFGTSDVSSVSGLVSSQLLDAYFGGLYNVIVGLRTCEVINPNITIFIIDCLRNAMGISDFFLDIDGATAFFNAMFYRGTNIDAQDQIVPTIIQGMMYFGEFLCFIPTVIMTWVVCWADRKWAETQNIEYAYLFASFAVIVGWAVPGNLTHLTTNVFNFLIPTWLLIYVNQIRLKK